MSETLSTADSVREAIITALPGVMLVLSSTAEEEMTFRGIRLGVFGVVVAAVSGGWFAPLAAQSTMSRSTSVDSVLVATARDYIDGFAQGDTVRMRRALHSDLAKRELTGRMGSPSNMTASDLVGITGRRPVNKSAVLTPVDSIRVIEVYKDMAMVRVGATGWVDYLHLGRFGEKWQIINVAWQVR